MNDKHTSNSGIGFFGLLTIVFITLKLLGHITWSWWWVLSPPMDTNDYWSNSNSCLSYYAYVQNE